MTKTKITNQMRKKVLIIQPFLSYGGAESVSIGICKYLQKRDVDARLVALFFKKNADRSLEGINLSVALPPLSGIFERNRIVLFLLGFPMLISLVWRESKNATLLNPHNFPTLWIAVIIGKLRNIPVVWTVHNFPQSKLDFINGIFAKYCKKIVAVSPKVKRQIFQKYKLKAEVSYPAVDFDLFSKGKRRKLSKKPVVLVVSRIAGNKNINVVLEAVRDKDVDLLIAGEGNLNTSVPKNVKLLGFQNHDQLRDLYASADFLILPSFKTEGFNLVPFEAGSAGTPSIVAKGSGVDEIFEKYNLGIVSKPDAKSISDAIDTMLQRKWKFPIKKWTRDHLNVKNYSIYD